jgi:AAA15 family ATPase/GTPase
LQGFKNVDRGRIDFPLYKEGRRSVEEAEIVGLYGQNGSGKTAVIDAVHFMQLLMLGQSLKDSQIEDYLNSETGMAELELTFLVETAVWQGYLTYKVVICKNDVGKGFVRQEELSAVRYEQDKRQQKTLLLRYEGTKSEIFTPKKLLNLFVFNKQEAQMKLQLSRMLSEKTQTSFIFSNMTLEEFAKQDRVEVKEIALLLTQLRSFAVGDLFVVRTNHTGLISANFILPLFFKMNNFAGGLKGDLDIPLNGPFLWPLMGKAYNGFIN